MATATKILARTALPTSSETLYAAQQGTVAVVTNILVVNTSAASATFTLDFDDIEVFPGTEIPGKGTISIELKQVLDGAVQSQIHGFASADTVKVHISGVEIS